ncbi:SatD family protein [Flavobacterium sp. NKUCC04_CG]|uniref:SatD family protein n=1 Tax=Flavobacterium sp. NKUCC04_CG TaxID=2842121 RepID=UPI001C5B8C66|nr:SatD family protein [Flavobacterium sp. NKUCC04_CG]MBW3519599.1 SatD family protein [Flavobacterium sp. NKUCC04_CG]
MKYPILMADIVDSRKADQILLINEFKRIVNYINNRWEMSILSPLTITLGDEFQGVIKDMESCYKLVFDMEEFIIEHSLSIKLRYVMNYGIIETPINRDIAYEMLGDGLTQAREQLNKLKASSNRFMILSDKNEMNSAVISDLFLLYGSYIDSWKLNEYQMVSEFLKDKDYKVVAKNLGMNKSSTWRRYKSLHIEEYKTTKDLILTLNRIL